MDGKNNKIQSSVIVVGVVGLILGFIIGYMVGGSRAMSRVASEMNVDNVRMEEAGDISFENGSVATNEAQSSFDDNLSVSGGVNLAVNTTDAVFSAEAQTAGNVVIVHNVSANRVTWVAVRENNDGALGNILGARRIEAGNNQNVTVELLRPTTAENEYFVVLFEDNGDMMFDHRTDFQVVKEGEVLAASFSAQ